MDVFALQTHAFALDEGCDSRCQPVFRRTGQGREIAKLCEYTAAKSPTENSATLAAVATELETGRRVVLVRGNAGQVVRDQSSIPGVFEPVMISSKRYVDGGVVSPVPVDAAHELGADFIIAVDISKKPAMARRKTCSASSTSRLPSWAKAGRTGTGTRRCCDSAKGRPDRCHGF